MNENECCPRLDPTLWDDKILVWDNKKFIKGKVKTIFFIPIGFGKEITKLQKLVTDSDGIIEDYLCLSIHPTKWGMDIYLAVNKEIVNAENVTISGTYYSKVYEGDFNQTGRWMEDYEKTIREKGLNCNIKDVYMWYTTCPKCAKKYGKNYVVVIGQIK